MADDRWWKEFDALSVRHSPQAREFSTSAAATAGWLIVSPNGASTHSVWIHRRHITRA